MPDHKQKRPTSVGVLLRRIKNDPRLAGAQVHRMVRTTKRDAFTCLVAAMLSTRTKDEVTAEAAERLLRRAPTPEALLELPEVEIGRLIYPVGFWKQKAAALRTTCQMLVSKHGGRVPDTLDELLQLKGVGLKIANLVLGRVFGKPAVCVDTHVHRIFNRWGMVSTKAPEETEQKLRELIPRRYWVELNGILVAFGQTICTPISPRCSTCPVEASCEKVGVGSSR